MKRDLEDALVPVEWAQAQIPVLQDRFLSWQRSYPYKLVCEPEPTRPDRELLIAYLQKPLDPLIIGDVGAIINSVRTGLDLMMVAIVARHGVAPERAPSFPIREKPSDFFERVAQLRADKWISADEAAAVERTKAYDGGDHVLWHIAKLDNLRKHQRLLFVEPLPTQLDLTSVPYAERLMLHSHAQNRSSLYRIPAGSFRPTRGNTSLGAEIFLNETDSGVGMRSGMVAVRAYVDRVSALIESFP